MTRTTPKWAMRPIEVEDRGDMEKLLRRGLIEITWPEIKSLKRWAGEHHWPTPWFGFKESFMEQILESDSKFLMGLKNSGVKMCVPRQQVDFDAYRLRDLDELYKARNDDGRPSDWRQLVEELRELRRAIEAGVAIKVEEGSVLRSWQGFYSWASSRYAGLEDGCDAWIGDDNS
jgi:hypothetical protein